MTDENIYIILNKKLFEKNKKAFSDESDDEQEYLINHLAVINGKQIRFKQNDKFEFDFEKEVIEIGGDIVLDNSEYLGYASMTVKMDVDTMSKVVSAYIKKLNKLRNVLESVQ